MLMNTQLTTNPSTRLRTRSPISGEMSDPNCMSVVRNLLSLLSCLAPQAGGSCCPIPGPPDEGGDGVRPFRLLCGEWTPFIPVNKMILRDLGLWCLDDCKAFHYSIHSTEASSLCGYCGGITCNILQQKIINGLVDNHRTKYIHRQSYPSKHNTLIQCLFDDSPPSTTLAQIKVNPLLRCLGYTNKPMLVQGITILNAFPHHVTVL